MNMSLAQASVWGSASTNLSWASKTAPPNAPPVSNPAPVQQQQQPSAQFSNNAGKPSDINQGSTYCRFNRPIPKFFNNLLRYRWPIIKGLFNPPP